MDTINLMEGYKVGKTSSGTLIMDDRGKPMETHLGTVYPPLSEALALVLKQDINEIINVNFFLKEGKKSIVLNPEEVLGRADFSEIRKHQERQSFSVCVENTLIEMGNDASFNLPIRELIQWDMLYRMSADPRAKMDQVIVCAPAIEWLGQDWKDLSGNYCGSLEEMEADGVPFVEEPLIARIEELWESLSYSEKVTVWFLFEFFQRYSITLPILWVKDQIDGEVLEDAYYVLASDFSEKEIRKMKKEEGDFVQRRLRFLREYLKVRSCS